MVKHRYSVANSSRQLLGTHWYQCCYGSGYNSQACSFGQSTVVSVALGQRLKAGGLVLTVLHLPLTWCDSRHTQFFWPLPSGTLPGLPTPGQHPLRLRAPPPTSPMHSTEKVTRAELSAGSSCLSGKKRASESGVPELRSEQRHPLSSETLGKSFILNEY